VVLQDVFLRQGSVEQNLTLGDPEIDRARVERAARHVNAERFIMALGGYDAPLR
jgi:ATP-binding cassette subfamily B protein